MFSNYCWREIFFRLQKFIKSLGACAPLSYRSVDENDYREAILVFYELNSIMPFKKIFMAQYVFAAQNYLVK